MVFNSAYFEFWKNNIALLSPFKFVYLFPLNPDCLQQFLNNKLKPMRKLISILSTAAICFLISCNSKEPAKESNAGGMSDKAKKNLEASHIVSDAFMSGDPSKIDSAVA